MKYACRFSILALVALATGCGEYSEGTSLSEAQIDLARHRLRPTVDKETLAGASALRKQDSKSNPPANLIPSQKLLPVNASNIFEGVTEDTFGEAVAISGNTVAIGAPDRDEAAGNQGAVYIYVNDNGVWSLQQKLLAKAGALNDNFGFSLALEGDRLIVGARRGGGNGTPQSGAALIYERVNKVWKLSKTLDPANTGFEDFFGYSVALYQNYALIGAPQADNAVYASGAAFLYQYSGTDWVLAKKFTLDGGATYDFYGGAVALLPPTGAIGVTALIGAWNDGDNPANNDGAVYAYSDPGANGQPWGLQAKLIASDQSDGDTFGFTIAAAGQRAFIGAPFRTSNCAGAGAVYVFNRHSGVWCEEAIITAFDENAGQLFGYSVAALPETVLIGSYTDDDGGDYSGSAYVYTYNNPSWDNQLKFVPDDTAPNQFVGSAVALDGDQAVVGALGGITNNVNAGTTYLFSASGAAPVVEPPTTSLVNNQSAAQCSLHHGPSSSDSSWFIGIAIAAWGVRRSGRRARR